MNHNFKTLLLLAPHLQASFWLIAYKIDMQLTPKLISECTTNSNVSANHGDNEIYRDNENHPYNKNEGNYPANKYMLKVNNRKNILVSLWLSYFTLCSSVFNIDFENVIVQ